MRISARSGCVLVTIIGFILLALLWAVLTLAIQGEIQLQRADLTGYRLWLLAAEDSRGLGFSNAQVVPGDVENGDHCVMTTSRFILWRSGDQERVQVYCECYSNSDSGWLYSGTCMP